MSSCPMLDNPERLREMVTKSGAHSTDFLAPESAEELTAKTEAAAVVRQITETNCGGRRTIRSKVASANRRFTILQPKWIGKADAFRAGRPSPIQGTTERRRTGCAAPPPSGMSTSSSNCRTAASASVLRLPPFSCPGDCNSFRRLLFCFFCLCRP